MKLKACQSPIFLLLSKYRVSEILDIARQQSLTGYSNRKKEDLINMVIEHILEPNTAEAYFQCMEESELFLFEAVEKYPKKLEIEDFARYLYLFEGGYLFVNEQNELIIPEQIKQLYQTLNTDDFRKSRKRFRLLADYCNAANSLYGIIRMEKLVEIFNVQNKKNTTVDEVFNVYTKLIKHSCMFECIEGSLIHESLLEGEEYLGLLASQSDKPFYIPDKKELLNYADDCYFERTPEYEALKKYIVAELLLGEDMAEEICDDIQLNIYAERRIQDNFEEFSRRDIEFQEDNQLVEMAGLVMALWNNTRLLSNRGHTPNEIMQFMKERKVYIKKIVE